MIKSKNKIAVKLLFSVFLLIAFLGTTSGAARISGDDLWMSDSGADLLSDNPDDNTLSEENNSLDENRDSGTKDVEHSDEPRISGNQPGNSSFSIQIAAFNDESKASFFVENNRRTLNGYDIFYKDNGELFKVLIGHFNSLEEASYQLREVYDLGYADTFITKLSR